jgi:hypothetical protein
MRAPEREVNGTAGKDLLACRSAATAYRRDPAARGCYSTSVEFHFQEQLNS